MSNPLEEYLKNAQNQNTGSPKQDGPIPKKDIKNPKIELKSKDDVEPIVKKKEEPSSSQRTHRSEKTAQVKQTNKKVTDKKNGGSSVWTKKPIKMFGGLVVGIAVIGIGTVFAFKLISTHTSSANASTENPLMKGLQQAAIQQYTDASTEFDKVPYEKVDKDSQKAILFSYLLSGKADKALKYEPKFAESVVSYYIAIDNLEKIKSIKEKNDIIDFEKAALNKNYKNVIALKDKVNMDGRREKLIVESYINMKKYDDCFTFAKQQGNKTLMKEVKELEKQEIQKSTLPDEEKKAKIEQIDKVLTTI
ncbi:MULTISPECIES: hypothetical protein [Bacillus]|uniref:hypothetical protein n=1 Tax=Bacillus cereus TaxID=1396 RepID=UPI00159B84EF|nr:MULTISPECIES: hypothetical protein [Bacillus]